MQEFTIVDSISSYINFDEKIDSEITITGMVQNSRVTGWGGFIIIRTPNNNIQCVLDRNTLNIEPEAIKVEAAIKITGIVKSATIKDISIVPRNIEIHVKTVEILSSPSENPLPVDTTKKELNINLNTNFDKRPLTLRHPRQRAIFRISSTIFNEFGNFLTTNGFTRICSPKIVKTGAEGGANIFKLDYFETNAYLAQSPQFYKQIMIGTFGRVFEEAPVFRAEKHDTSRHLNEYISLDLEMILENGFTDLIQVETKLLKHIFSKLNELCSNELELLGVTVPDIEKIVTIKFDDVHDIIFKEFNKDYRGEKDLAPEEESLICGYAKKNWDTELLFVTHFPTVKRPFYTMDDPDDEGKTLSFDLLFRGMEITTGGQRLNVYDDYLKKMKSFGLNTELFDSYLQSFRYGMPPHGGLGLGLERLTALICGLSNVKEASLFPRDINRLEP
ncbi:MAG: aspartate--tRNA(Asn) ligase [Spirochaetes bacterium GWF1_31_7]|nr:MAG: aspartate--tRNA(Asn) ligase [Spirochaetes bacterium GWE1_32_154]OHD47580.1 MAG: aspartate--tRNA(Asn) ligase [Spirochaetes bacterium GWE2_31_10]OHD51241.1 MAG: aspartate--tRNA(Asn) ligase [Spirochaetes bacterium GWF1_31_7]OHD81234.1 MAG: aspartate--tRNA(Asn) ligase [Spirochaetes bacterium RIFOXYB1_FULL_32_8]HBD96137.1 aspartate--tRNA(Asn) ligase [Spirochaetia bacterium]